jgi:hypothetical protein
MTVHKRVSHCLKVTNGNKEYCESWFKTQIGKKVHPLLNKGKHTQEEIDAYWKICIKLLYNSKLLDKWNQEKEEQRS